MREGGREVREGGREGGKSTRVVYCACVYAPE